MSHDDDEALISELVSQALEAREDRVDGVDGVDGSDLDVEALCADRPDLTSAVRAALETALRFPTFQSGGFGVDRMVGSLLQHRYRIVERVGAGAMGVVYLASDLELPRQVAIKVLHLGLMDRDQALARFEREAEALAAIQHEAVVTIHDRGITDDGAPFLVMDYIDGVSLSSVLEAARARARGGDESAWLTEEFGIEHLEERSFLRQAVRWCAGLASGLHAAHGAGVYHRDVKPSNVIIRRDGRPVLLDFGIAATDSQASLTRTDAAVGTPAYMAPEALAGNAKARPAQDVYGLTATLYHLLTLRAPYEGSPSQVMTALATREPALAVRIRPGLPRDIQAILDTGMARRASERYAAADALEFDLRAFLAYQPVSARRTSAVGRAWRRVRRSRAVQGAAVVAACAVAYFAHGEWSDERAVQRGITFYRAWNHVPANLGIVMYSHRVLAVDAANREILSVLDETVDAGHEVLAPRTLRAACRLDQGDFAGAALDMRAVANRVGTPYARALADRYAALDPATSEPPGVSLDDLPAPETAEDHYLAGFHTMRNLRYAEAVPFLRHEGLAGIRHAQELRVLAEVSTIPLLSPEDRLLAARKAFGDALRIDGQFGGRSAMTGHLAAMACSVEGTYESYGESLRICEEALSLAPNSHVTMINAARDAFRIEELDRADHWAQAAMRLLPHYDKPYGTSVLVALARDDFDLAHALLERTPFAPSARGAYERLCRQLLIEATEALHHHGLEGSGGEAEAAAKRGLAAFREIQEMTKNPGDDNTVYASLCEAVIDDSEERIFQILIQRQLPSPLMHGRLRMIAAAFPERIEGTSLSLMSDLVVSIADALDRRQQDQYLQPNPD